MNIITLLFLQTVSATSLYFYSDRQCTTLLAGYSVPAFDKGYQVSTGPQNSVKLVTSTQNMLELYTNTYGCSATSGHAWSPNSCLDVSSLPHFNWYCVGNSCSCAGQDW